MGHGFDLDTEASIELITNKGILKLVALLNEISSWVVNGKNKKIAKILKNLKMDMEMVMKEFENVITRYFLKS